MIKSESTKFERIDLDSIFRRYYRPLCLYALHYLHIAEDAEDVVKDCLTEFLERSEKGYLVSDVKSYLYIYPTLLNLLGLEKFRWSGFGQSILDPRKPGIAISPKRKIDGDTLHISADELLRMQQSQVISDRIIRFDKLKDLR